MNIKAFILSGALLVAGAALAIDTVVYNPITRQFQVATNAPAPFFVPKTNTTITIDTGITNSSLFDTTTASFDSTTHTFDSN